MRTRTRGRKRRCGTSIRVRRSPVTTPAPTVDQLADYRADLGDPASAPAFTDPELTRLWQRAGGNPDRALLLAVRQLLVNAVRFDDYSFGMNAASEKKSQVFDHLVLWEKQLSLRAGGGLATVDLRTRTGGVPLDPTLVSTILPTV